MLSQHQLYTIEAGCQDLKLGNSDIFCGFLLSQEWNCAIFCQISVLISHIQKYAVALNLLPVLYFLVLKRKLLPFPFIREI